MTQLITPTTPEIYRVRVANNRAAILAALTTLAKQTDPMTGHGGLLLDVLESLRAGGVDVAGLLDCVMGEVGQ